MSGCLQVVERLNFTENECFLICFGAANSRQVKC